MESLIKALLLIKSEPWDDSVSFGSGVTDTLFNLGLIDEGSSFYYVTQKGEQFLKKHKDTKKPAPPNVD